MRTVRISPDETSLYETLNEGHPVQVRVSVSPGEEKDYKKGTTVKVSHPNGEAEARIVSDPIEINTKTDEGKKTLSLVLEKP